MLHALTGEFDVLILDREAHYSVQEAARHSGLPIVLCDHRSPEHLSILLRNLAPAARPLFLCDGVSPISGAIAPLDACCRLLGEHAGAGILVDDAHGFGVLGAGGRGTWEHFGIAAGKLNREPAEPTGAAGPRCFGTLTLSKAIGGHGGLIAGSRAFIARLRHSSGIFAGGSAPAAPVAAASAAGLRLALGDGELRARLQRNVQLRSDGLARLGLPAGNGLTPIVSLVPGDGRRLGELQAELCCAATSRWGTCAVIRIWDRTGRCGSPCSPITSRG